MDHPKKTTDDEFEVSADSEADRLAKALKYLPAQDASKNRHGTELTITRQPGRPRKVETMPQRSDLEYHALMAEARQQYVETDSIVKVIDANGTSADVLLEIKKAVAREASSMAFESIELQKRGRDTTQASRGRLDALKKIAEIELKLRELNVDHVNLGSEKFQKVFAFWVETMRQVAQEVMPPEMLNLFFSRFATAMEGWEEKATELTK